MRYGFLAGRDNQLAFVDKRAERQRFQQQLQHRTERDPCEFQRDRMINVNFGGLIVFSVSAVGDAVIFTQVLETILKRQIEEFNGRGLVRRTQYSSSGWRQGLGLRRGFGRLAHRHGVIRFCIDKACRRQNASTAKQQRIKSGNLARPNPRSQRLSGSGPATRFFRLPAGDFNGVRRRGRRPPVIVHGQCEQRLGISIASSRKT